MKALIISPRFGFSILCPLICGFLCLFLATGASAGDPDDDWGLPTVTDDPSDGDSSSSSEDPTDLQIGLGVTETDPDDDMGQLVVDLLGETGTSYVENASPNNADVGEPSMTAGPVTDLPVQVLNEGLAIQGRMSLNMPYMGEGSLQAILKSPVDAVSVKALFSVDTLDSIEELLADPSGIPAGVSTVLPVGGVATVNLNAFQKLVDSYGHLLTSGHVSVVVLSTDNAGDVHVAAARIAATGGTMEILIR